MGIGLGRRLVHDLSADKSPIGVLRLSGKIKSFADFIESMADSGELGFVVFQEGVVLVQRQQSEILRLHTSFLCCGAGVGERRFLLLVCEAVEVMLMLDLQQTGSNPEFFGLFPFPASLFLLFFRLV